MTMKTLLVLCALVSAVLARPGDTYDPKYDNFNAEELVSNVRLLKAYAKCFLDQGPCTSEGTDFKRVIPEALRTTCAKCSAKQRDLVRIVIKGFQEKLPQEWEKLIDKEDPERKYQKAFIEFLNRTD